MKRFGFTAVAVAAPFVPLDQGDVVIHDGQA
ncbi:MAG: hypothetical protein QOF27_1663 [Gaiellaceae bacterium]|jgi:hypothetical protein|nr:hypothetical protein [Gaiellaceae bacterium]